MPELICPQCYRSSFSIDIDQQRLVCLEPDCQHIVTREELYHDGLLSILLYGNEPLRRLGIVHAVMGEPAIQWMNTLFPTPPGYVGTSIAAQLGRPEVEYSKELADVPTIDEMWEKMERLGIARE